MSPPAGTGLSHRSCRVMAAFWCSRVMAAFWSSRVMAAFWSSRVMAAFIQRTEGVYVSHHYVAKLWRENGLKPHRTGTFKVSKDPAFAEKVADIVGLYLDPPGGAVVLSLDEKTQIRRWTGPSRCCRSPSTFPGVVVHRGRPGWLVIRVRG
jgi:hypothetical protein